ncbi:MAG: phosphatase PAP2 family protein [Gemmatimonadales bacterium]
MAALATICLLLFALLTAAVMGGWTEAWDTRLMLRLATERRPGLTVGMKLLSVTGSGLVEFPVAFLLIGGLLARGRKPQAGWYAGAVLSGWVLYALAKLAAHRHRPHVISHLMHGAGWYSYPSGHSMLAPLIFGLGAIAWSTPWRSPEARLGTLALAALLALAIGVSRVYLGSHYPSDVIGGLLLGTGWSALSVLWWERRGRLR